MKIAYLINHIGQTGVNNVVLDLVVQMVAHGHECCVFYQKEVEEGMKIVDYPCEVRRLQSWDDLNGYDVVHAHGMGPEMLALKARLRSKMKGEKLLRSVQGCKSSTAHSVFTRSSAALHLEPGTSSGKFLLVTTLHCYCFQDFFDLYGKVKGAAMGVAYLLTKKVFDRVVCLSKDMMQYYERWIPKRKLTYVYNTRSIDTAQLTVSDEEQEMLMRCKGDGVLIGMNCVLLYRKGIDVMLKAMALLPDRFRLMIVGDGKEKETFQQMAQELGVEQRVCFAGRRNEACRYLPYYDIYAMPSRSEGFPLVLLESAACGTKVVASSLPVVKECFTDDEVVTFDMPDAQALANAIIKADEMEQLGENLKKRFEQDYAPEVFYRRYMEVYKRNGE